MRFCSVAYHGHIHLDKAVRQLMVKTKVGIRMSVSLLDKMVVLHEAEEGSEAGKAFDIG